LHTQSERCHQHTKGYVKITAKRIKSDLISEKSYKTADFSIGTINNVLNRLGYTLKKVRKTLPLKRIEQTDDIFNNVSFHRKKKSIGTLKLSIDVKDKVRVGELSRKGYHRNKTDVCALDKDQHWDETLVPFGILDIESAKTTVILGNSNETSDFIVDGLEKWYELEKENLQLIHTLEIYSDNGPAVHSNRTQFINRMMEFSCITNLNIHLIYYPPYHSKYNPIERVWAAVEQYWNGTILSSVDKVVNTIQNVKWKNVNLKAIFMNKEYQKGITLSDKEMKEREAFLVRNPELEKWDVWIKPSFDLGRLFFG
jgi:hypothetical protein